MVCAVLCCVLLCCVMLRYVTLRYVTLRFVMCYAMLCILLIIFTKSAKELWSILGPKLSPYIIQSAGIFSFRFFVIREDILRNQKFIIG